MPARKVLMRTLYPGGIQLQAKKEFFCIVKPIAGEQPSWVKGLHQSSGRKSLHIKVPTRRSRTGAPSLFREGLGEGFEAAYQGWPLPPFYRKSRKKRRRSPVR